MFNISLEAMQAQVQSKLGLELDKLWQSVIDYRDNELKSDTSYASRKRKLCKFFEANVAQKFIDIVRKYTGMTVVQVKTLDMFSTGSFCTWIYLGADNSFKGTFQVEDMLNGGYLSRYWSMQRSNLNAFTAEELMKLASSYDAIHGCIKPEMRDEVKKIARCTIGFDVTLGFLVEDLLPKNSDVKNFTARELTAIMLHEIGHNMTLIEHAGDMYAHTASFNYLTQSFINTNAGNGAEALKLAKMAAAKADATGNTDAAKKINSIVNKFAADMSAAGASANPVATRKLIEGLLYSIMCILGDLILIPFNFIFGSAVMKKYASTSAEQKKKFSDIPCNERLCTWQERKADEYAFSHGYGAALALALSKIGQFIRFYGVSEKQAERLRLADELGKNISILEKFKLLVIAPAVCGGYSYTLYPAASKRFKELLKITIQQLKANGAQPEYVAKYMADIDRILDKIEHYDKRDEFMAKAVKGYELFMAYCSIPSFVDMIVHGHVRKEVETLVNELQDVGSNLIDYYGNKFINAAKKG